ncbi:MAG: hypothetical protein KGM99_20465 [Burkholderiales bacterium]|nr:hypothetical protein [Burkholderiales bacterium]
MKDDISNMANKLEKVINTRLVGVAGQEPPRLVKANSAFDLLNALRRAEAKPELQKYLATTGK